MSRWHALEGTSFAEGNDGITLEYWPETDEQFVGRQMSDALANPTIEDVSGPAYALLPPGAAWGTPDDTALDTTSRMAGFWRGVVSGLRDWYIEAWIVTMDSTSGSLARGLLDWELEWGLPDPCADRWDGEEVRYQRLRRKVTSLGTISPGDFLNYADSLGYGVVIEEPVICEAGYFECGGSDETGSPDGNFLVIFWILGAKEWGFEAGFGEAGYTPLYDFDQAEGLECSLTAILPAGYDPAFDYTELSTFAGGWPDAWVSVWS